jgi:chromosome segregation ATPase
LQQKINQAERELSQLKLELDQTKQQAKQAEVYAQESGRTNRKLKTEIQTLTDMSNRKDRQAENSKATAFFFEGQVKKYMDEIETARQGMGHLKELDDQLNQAKAEQAELEKSSKEEAIRVKATIKAMQDEHKINKESKTAEIDKAYAELEKASAHALQLQQEMQQKMDAELQPGSDIQTLEKEHRALEQKQIEAVKQVYEEVDQLRKKLEQSEASTLSHEENMVVVKEEMDRIMRRLRAIDQLSASTADTASAE